MKCTEYFRYMRNRPNRSVIQDAWIQQTIDKPVRTEIQSDNRIRKWSLIAGQEKYLRVILLPDGETVHNAFFDRRFKETEQDED